MECNRVHTSREAWTLDVVKKTYLLNKMKNIKKISHRHKYIKADCIIKFTIPSSSMATREIRNNHSELFTSTVTEVEI